MTSSSPKPPPRCIEVRGARRNNLRDLDVDIPLGRIVGVAGVSGSGKSSLALGVVYAEGSRRYLESLSTYTRRRMTQAARAEVDDVRYVPAALALHQRPGVPGVRSTFGTMSELLNSMRLMYSRLASHRCPNGHYHPPTLDVAAERELVCPECGARFFAPGAEELAFNSQGACRRCDGTGVVREVDPATIVPDDSLTIDEGAVAPWQSLMWSLMKDIARDMGVRTDVPWRDLTKRERDIVLHAPPEKRHVVYQMKTGESGEMDFTFFNAFYTVENALKNVKDEKGMKRVAKFLREGPCPDCGGTRLSERARAPLLRGISLDRAAAMTLAEAEEWVRGVPASLPAPMRPMAERICESFHDTSRRLLELGLSYLSLDRAASTLSTGERQRVQLARAVRNRTTGVLYVLDEPSIGLHPSNLEGLTGVMDDLVADGNSVLLVDHDTQVLSHADWIVELGPGAGARGGTLVAEGTPAQLARDKRSVIGPFLCAEKKSHAENKSHAARAEPSNLRTFEPSNVARKRDDPAEDRGHPHREAARGRVPEGAAQRRHGRVRIGQDHARPREPRPGARRDNRRPPAAGAHPRRRRARHRARQARRRHSDRHQRALDRRDLRRRPRRAAQGLRPHAGGEGAGPQGRRLLLQHRLAPLPDLRRHGRDLP